MVRSPPGILAKLDAIALGCAPFSTIKIVLFNEETNGEPLHFSFT
jgi:Asp/Glu/hydantoin racemase